MRTGFQPTTSIDIPAIHVLAIGGPMIEPFKMSVLQITMPSADAAQFESGQWVWRYSKLSEWSKIRDEIREMGFESEPEQQIMEAIVEAEGDLKLAVRSLVVSERNARNYRQHQRIMEEIG